MPYKANVKIEGLDRLQVLLKKQEGHILEEAKKIFKRHAELQLMDARSNLHDITGETAASLQILEIHKGKHYSLSVMGIADTDVPSIIRAQAIEYGHAAPGNGRGVKVVPAHPFIRPAYAEDKGATLKDIRKMLNKIVDDFNSEY